MVQYDFQVFFLLSLWNCLDEEFYFVNVMC